MFAGIEYSASYFDSSRNWVSLVDSVCSIMSTVAFVGHGSVEYRTQKQFGVPEAMEYVMVILSIAKSNVCCMSHLSMMMLVGSTKHKVLNVYFYMVVHIEFSKPSCFKRELYAN